MAQVNVQFVQLPQRFYAIFVYSNGYNECCETIVPIYLVERERIQMFWEHSILNAEIIVTVRRTVQRRLNDAKRGFMDVLALCKLMPFSMGMFKYFRGQGCAVSISISAFCEWCVGNMDRRAFQYVSIAYTRIWHSIATVLTVIKSAIIFIIAVHYVLFFTTSYYYWLLRSLQSIKDQY